MNMTYFIGIDPGKDGAIVIVDSDLAIAARVVTPTIGIKGKRQYDIPAMRRLLESYSVGSSAFIEKVSAMPGQGVSSMFSMGFGLGVWHGLLSGMEIPFTAVTPQAWQKVICAGLPKGNAKANSALIASRLWPQNDWRATERCRNSHDGLTDAALIAEYGRRTANIR